VTARSRILAIKLSQKLIENPGFAEKVGVKIDFEKVRSTSRPEKTISKQ